MLRLLENRHVGLVMKPPVLLAVGNGPGRCRTLDDTTCAVSFGKQT